MPPDPSCQPGRALAGGIDVHQNFPLSRRIMFPSQQSMLSGPLITTQPVSG